MSEQKRPQYYTFQVASEIAERYRAWSSVEALDAKWFKVLPFADGTAEVLLSTDDERPGLPQDMDVIGYERAGLEYCLRCAPGRVRHEIYELHRFEASGGCDQCGTELLLETGTFR